MDEVFGSENFHAQINFKSTSALGQKGLAQAYDYIVWYAKSAEVMKFRPLFRKRDISGDREWKFVDDSDSQVGFRQLTVDELAHRQNDVGVFRRAKLTSSGFTKTCIYEFPLFGVMCKPFGGKSWLTTRQGMERLIRADRLFLLGKNPYARQYFEDFPVVKYDNSWSDQPAAQSRIYVVQTAEKFIDRCMLMTTDPGDLVLDPTCGSGTTAHVAEQRGRRWITIDTSRVAIALARTRLMADRFQFYLLADSPDGVQKEAEITGQLPPPHGTACDIKRGFVSKRVPHITPKTITNNEEIDVIHAKWQEKLEPVRKAFNKCLKQSREEWEIPRQADDGWPADAKKLHAEWWEMRRARQKEIDQSIARCAEHELLYDQPYEDRSIVRVTGPFTVESLSPHRRMSVEQKREGTGLVEGLRIKQVGPDRFGNMIIDNLKKAGIQNRVKQERLKFDTLEPFAGEWIHATGEYTDKSDASHCVALTIGPEHGTVSLELIREAAKEAVKGVGFELLVVCGFAFDPHVDEETKRYGDLEVLTCRMNPDLSMGDQLLKKTGAGNLFMIFGEPDISIKRVSADDAGGADKKKGKKNLRASAQSADEKTADNIVVEIHGVDVYDPTTGQIRSDSTDDIACWFIDTNYDGESFFVRHAYFTGAAEPYDKLKRALRAEIDESAWSALYATESQPFPPPETGKIAVKVINHYGDEVLKVYDVKS